MLCCGDYNDGGATTNIKQNIVRTNVIIYICVSCTKSIYLYRSWPTMMRVVGTEFVTQAVGFRNLLLSSLYRHYPLEGSVDDRSVASNGQNKQDAYIATVVIRFRLSYFVFVNLYDGSAVNV